MQLNPYLIFSGNCEAAFRLYERCLNGKIVAMVKHADTPAAPHVAAEWGSKIMHAVLESPAGALMGSDRPSGDYEQPKGFSVALHVDDPAEAERVFGALAENGSVQMPLQQTFWATRFGMLVDQFGIPWMINCATGS